MDQLSLSSLKMVHFKLLTDYGCTEWAPPAANAADDEQQRDDDNDRPSRTPRITGRGPWTITVSD